MARASERRRELKMRSEVRQEWKPEAEEPCRKDSRLSSIKTTINNVQSPSHYRKLRQMREGESSKICN